MENERPDEFLPWRGQLSRPDALPELGLEDNEMSWQRLAERLHKRPRRFGPTWRIAAACLILALFLPATHLFRNRSAQPKRVATHSTHITPHPDLLPAHPVTPLPPAGKLSPTAPTAMTVPTAMTPPTAPTPPRHASSGQANYGEIAPITSHTPAYTAALVPTSTPDTALATTPPELQNLVKTLAAVTPPPRHPLRIVYLNEINNPGSAPDRTSRQPTFLRPNTEAATEYTVNNNLPIIKINISSPTH